ncbi:neurogenic locus notch homolog protein 1-like isoform X2 [Watersipora subatra]
MEGDGISYLNARPEKRVYLLRNGVTSGSDSTELPPNIEDFNVVVNMEDIHRQLTKNSKESTTSPTPVQETSRQPKLRFQSTPKPFRPWDIKSDRLSVPYNQVAVGRTGNGYLQAVMTGQQTQINSQVNRREEINPRWVNEEAENEQVAAFRGRQIVTLPENGKLEKTTLSLRPEEDIENRKYFKPVPVETDLQAQEKADINVPSSKQCPEGYTPAISASEGNICFPTTALTQSIDKAPSRGDAAFICPTGHQPQSSVYGEACVPSGWQPCSGEAECSHNQNLPLVNPVVVESDCQAVSGESLPCKNSAPSQAYGPDNCNGDGCQINSCPSENCEDSENTDCRSGSCGIEVSMTGYCFNGGKELYDVVLRLRYCLCQQGFNGQRCERRAVRRPHPVDVYDGYQIEEEDIDECEAAGTQGRGPCAYACLNTVGSYKCLCPAGSIVAQDGVSCMSITCPKCMHGGHCDTETNKCVCPAGFIGDICEKDVNECEEVPGICSHECRNTFGSYACLCRQGYTLLKDGHSCVDWRCKPNCVNGGVCIKNRCLCPAGFSGIICQFNNRL